MYSILSNVFYKNTTIRCHHLEGLHRIEPQRQHLSQLELSFLRDAVLPKVIQRHSRPALVPHADVVLLLAAKHRRRLVRFSTRSIHATQHCASVVQVLTTQMVRTQYVNDFLQRGGVRFEPTKEYDISSQFPDVVLLLLSVDVVLLLLSVDRPRTKKVTYFRSPNIGPNNGPPRPVNPKPSISN